VLAQNGTHPLYGQVGWLRNTAPWPITVTSITTNEQNASGKPVVYLERDQTTPTRVSSKEPVWAKNASAVPYQLDGGSLRYLAFALTPQDGAVASMTSITVTYSGPLGRRHYRQACLVPIRRPTRRRWMRTSPRFARRLFSPTQRPSPN
jgi:hypothetical protein